jgi:Flp pilus assembly protein TadB
VRALTAQARLSGGILGALPVAFFLFLLVTSRDDVRAAFHSSAGLAAVLLGLVLEGAAFVWIRRLLRVT